MKLNLGSGKKRPPGYHNVDIDPDSGADTIADILKLPFEDDSADEILAIHVFEHLWLHEIPLALKEWKRVLKSGGLLVLEMPCLDKIIRNLLMSDKVQMTLWGLYGDPFRTSGKNVYELHKWCWNEKMLRIVLEKGGFYSIKFCEPLYHFGQRDFRVECCK